jgi:thiol:disulfide interchange protein DsbC
LVPCAQAASSEPQSLPEKGGASPVLSEEETISILKSFNMPEARVLSIRNSPVNGLWEVAVENKGQRFVIYVDSSKRYVTPGPFIDYAIHKDITRERVDELNKGRRVDLSKVQLQNALIGKADAQLKVVVFTDPG